MSQVDIVAKSNARVVPEGREQVIASLEGGILRELLVREGEADQVALRKRSGEQENGLSVEAFIARTQGLIAERSAEL